MFPYHGENPTSLGEIWQIDVYLPFDLLLGIFSEDMLLKMSKRKTFLSLPIAVPLQGQNIQSQVKGAGILESTISTSWEDFYLDLLWGTKEARQIPRKKQSEFFSRVRSPFSCKGKGESGPRAGCLTAASTSWLDDWLVLACGVAFAEGRLVAHVVSIH